LPGHQAQDYPLKKKAPDLKNLEESGLKQENQSENDHA
jgi:hypothetical protein